MLDISRSSAFRLAYTLVELGYLHRNEQTKTYRLGPRVLDLGFSFLASQELVDIAQPRLSTLRDETACSAHLGVLDGRDVVYLVRCPANRTLTSTIQVGTRLPAYASSMGRAILSFMPPDAVAQLYRGETLRPYTGQTPTTLAALRQRLDQDRRQGHVISRAAFEAGIASVAAPLFDASGSVVGAVNISTPEAADPASSLETDVLDAVLAAANDISSWLGYAGARKSA
jgi:DNA-binding IclR family transcriptional regulator